MKMIWYNDIIKGERKRGKHMTQNEMFMYDYLVETEIATAEELNFARNLVSGSWLEVLNSVLFIHTGYRDLEQYMEALAEEDE